MNFWASSRDIHSEIGSHFTMGSCWILHGFVFEWWYIDRSRYQAMDRIHRLGQFRPMTVTRLFIAHSIEDRILRLQEKKRLIFEGTVGQSNAALARLTEEDLRFLFSWATALKWGYYARVANHSAEPQWYSVPYLQHVPFVVDSTAVWRTVWRVHDVTNFALYPLRCR